MTCLICGKPISISSSKKTMDGRICNHCYSKIPSLFLKTSPHRTEASIRQAINCTSNNLSLFHVTSSFGRFHIDEIHGLFAISKKIGTDGKPIHTYDIYSIYDIEEISITCDSLSADAHSVYSNVKLILKLVKPDVDTEVIIKKRVKCQYKRVDSQHIQWSEPKDLTFFRSIFNQALTNVYNKVQEVLVGKTLHNWEIEKARTVFMLPEEYSETDLKKARRLLMKVYHPDVANEDTSRESSIINDMYDLLKTELDKEKRDT